MVDESGTCQLGSLTVHRLGFGTMQLPGPGVWGPPADHEAALAVLRRAVDLGVDLFDTADAYGPDVAEELVREALHPYPAIAAHRHQGRADPNRSRPVGHRRPARVPAQRVRGQPGPPGGGPDRPVPAAPRRPGAVPADDQFGTLKELRDEGKVAEVGPVRGVGRADRGGPPDRAGGQRAEPVQPRPAGGRRRGRLLRAERDRLHPVGPAGQRQAVAAGRTPRPGGHRAGGHRRARCAWPGSCAVRRS